MRKFFALFFLALFIHGSAAIEDHFRKLDKKSCISIRNVDFVYLINLDQRKERLEQCLRELYPYGIVPQRLPAIYGWTLTPEILNDIGMKFQHGMWTGRECVKHYPLGNGGNHIWVNLNGSCYGKAYFSQWMTPGAIGCTLSHLSVLQDAYDSGYHTIWVMEDDISVRDNPHKLSDLIEKLDNLVGKDGWDILYTDAMYLQGINTAYDILGQIPWMWRPDLPYFNLKPIVDVVDLGPDFVKIGSRIRAHSLIVRRSGMEKILQFFKTRNMFTPYDHEIFLVPGIRVFVIKKDIVTAQEVSSDTKFHFFD